MKFHVWQTVLVRTKGEDHEREGQAGTVHETNPDHPEEVVVKFDKDLGLVAVANADLVAL